MRRTIDDTLALRMLEMKKTMTYAEVAKATGFSPSAVEMALVRRGYILRKKHRQKDRICPICGTSFGGDIRKQFCSRQCKDAHAHGEENAKKYAQRRRDYTVVIDDDISLRKLFARESGVCYICGCDTNFNDTFVNRIGNKTYGKTYPTIDHVIPLSKGGLHSWDNVRLACHHCNLSKGTKVVI